jgi:O-antigen/teichoic acid export membrane protein
MSRVPRIDFTTFQTSGTLFAGRMALGIAVHVIIKLAGIFKLFVFTRLLSTAELGTFALLTITATLMAPFFEISSPGSFGVLSAELMDKHLIRRNFSSISLTSLLFMGVMMSAIVTGLWRFFPGGLGLYLFILLAFTFSILARDYAIMVPQTYQKSGIIALFTLTTEYIGLILAIVLILWTNNGFQGAVWGYILTYLIASIILLFLLISDIGFTFSIDWELVRASIKFSLPFMPLVVLQWFSQSMGQYFLSYYSSTAVVGIYSTGVSIVSPILMLLGGLAFVWPTLQRLLREGDLERFYRYLNYLLKFIILILIIIIPLFYLAAPLLVKILVSAEYADAEKVVPFLAIAYSLLILTTFWGWPLLIIKKPHLVLFAFLTTTIAGIILNFILVPIFDMIGASLAMSLSYLPTLVILSYLAKRNYSIKISRASVINSIIFASIVLPLGFIFGYISSGSFPAILGLTSIFLMICFLLLKILDLVRPEEILILRQLITRAQGIIKTKTGLAQIRGM